MSWTPQRIKTRRTLEDAVEQIKFALLAGDLRVGDRLPPERTLAEIMGISRPTLRDAIAVLSDAGALRVEPGSGGGIFVRSESVPASQVQTHVEIAVSEVASVLEARRLVEPHVAQLAGIFGTESDFRHLQQTLDRHREVVDDHVMSMLLDDRFHIGLARATGNPVLVEMVHRLLKQLHLAADMDYRMAADPCRGIAAHEDTLAAVMSRDPRRIRIAMDEHLSILEDMWEAEAGRPRLRRFQDQHIFTSDQPV